MVKAPSYRAFMRDETTKTTIELRTCNLWRAIYVLPQRLVKETEFLSLKF